MNHIKFQNFLKVSGKMKRQRKTSPSVNQNNIEYLPSRQERVKVYMNKVGSMSKVNNKDTRTRSASLRSLLCLYRQR